MRLFCFDPCPVDQPERRFFPADAVLGHRQAGHVGIAVGPDKGQIVELPDTRLRIPERSVTGLDHEVFPPVVRADDGRFRVLRGLVHGAPEVTDLADHMVVQEELFFARPSSIVHCARKAGVSTAASRAVSAAVSRIVMVILFLEGYLDTTIRNAAVEECEIGFQCAKTTWHRITLVPREATRKQYERKPESKLAGALRARL